MPAILKRKRQDVAGRPLKKRQGAIDAIEEIEEVDDAGDGFSSQSEDGETEDEEVDEKSKTHPGNQLGHGEKHASQLPSASELRAINEANNLYKSNTFKAQLDLLLDNVRPKGTHISHLERTLQKIHTHFTSLSPISPIHPLEAAEALSTLKPKKKNRQSVVEPSPVAIPYPLPIPPPGTAWKVAFEPPAVMNVVGSWSDGLAVRKPDGTLFGVDLIVEMPVSLFQEKDFRNSRFFYKRAFYLACLAASFVNSSFNIRVEYEAAEGDSRLTTLLLTPCKDSTEYDFSNLCAAIRIIPVIPDDAPIRLHRLSPSESNIRGAPAKDPEHSEAECPPTPHYNNTLALFFARVSRTRLISAHHLLGVASSFKDGLALLRIWANQRGYGSGAGKNAKKLCVRGFEGLGAWWACILEVLILGEEGGGRGKNKNKRPLVGKGLSSYQLFRAALDFLSKHDFEKEPVFMKVVEHGQKFNPTLWTENHHAVFVDATGAVNMLAGVPPSSLQMLRHDATHTLHILNTSSNPFSPVFLTDLREPHARFDTVIRINLAHVRYHSSLDFSSSQAATLHALISTVRKALNTRAVTVVPLHPPSSPRALTFSQPSALPTLTLGIIFDPTHATRLVDHGPSASASSEDLAAFRAFWGAKAELRRFKDGKIEESCVWDKGIVRVEDREGIPARIVQYILREHFGLEEADVCVLGGDYGSVVTAPMVRGRGESGYRDARAAYERLYKELKALEDEKGGELPLMILAAKPCSPALRYTSIFPPSPVSSSSSLHSSTSHLPAFDIALQLERSSAWPDDLRAVQRVKLALYEGMARGLTRRLGEKTCRACVVVEDEGEGSCKLEVMLDGWAFHLRIAHDREPLLLQSPSPTLSSHSSSAHHASALHIYHLYHTHAPQHHNAILALHHKYPAFSHSVRLVKRWFGAHWLSARVGDEALELLSAYVFLGTGSALTGDVREGKGYVPVSGKRGFICVLRFLQEWDGVAHVPLYEAVRDLEGGGIYSGVEVEAEQGAVVEAGKGLWRLTTLVDPRGTVWCADVSIPVASRVRALAKATMVALGELQDGLKSLFTHPTTDYDFLIELEPWAVTRYWQGVSADPSVWNTSRYANLPNNTGIETESIRVEYNPSELYMRDLQKVFSDVLELFYDVHGGTMIGGVWNPAVAGDEREHEWRVFLGFTSLPTEAGEGMAKGGGKGKARVLFNKEGALAEMRRIGAGIVRRITVRT